MSATVLKFSCFFLFCHICAECWVFALHSFIPPPIEIASHFVRFRTLHSCGSGCLEQPYSNSFTLTFWIPSYAKLSQDFSVRGFSRPPFDNARQGCSSHMCGRLVAPEDCNKNLWKILSTSKLADGSCKELFCRESLPPLFSFHALGPRPRSGISKIAKLDMMLITSISSFLSFVALFASPDGIPQLCHTFSLNRSRGSFLFLLGSFSHRNRHTSRPIHLTLRKFNLNVIRYILFIFWATTLFFVYVMPPEYC